ncbi:VanW family protein [Clostridium sp. LP20]|uniref:VanW family protein n=1 Tax=Clostridium sp. LP20 TaxID=3418665 RepID=UPI003EE6DC82
MKSVKKKKGIIYSIYFKIAALAIVAISAFLAYSISINGSVKKWEDKVYPGVNIKGIDLSGKTREEVVSILNQELVAKIGEKKLNVTVGNNKLVYKYEDLSGNYNIEKAVDEAIGFGKKLNLFKKDSLIRNKDNSSHEINLDFNYEEGKIKAVEEDIKKNVNITPTKAKMVIKNGSIEITPDKIGYKVNTENLDETIKGAINGDLDEDTNVSFELEEEKSNVTKEELQKIKAEPMSSFTTSFIGSDANRSYNIELVTELVNGTILMPGEEFSYSTISQKGRGKYAMGIAYENDKPVPSEGGGICQGSTTLYRAVMRANIRSTERYNHSLPVGYSRLGLDATVAWGYLDYKFKNPYDFPIYIEGITSNQTVTFKIYGDPAVLGNKTYDMVSEISGKEAISYQVTYENGQEVKRERVAKDIYK